MPLFSASSNDTTVKHTACISAFNCHMENCRSVCLCASLTHWMEIVLSPSPILYNQMHNSRMMFVPYYMCLHRPCDNKMINYLIILISRRSQVMWKIICQEKIIVHPCQAYSAVHYLIASRCVPWWDNLQFTLWCCHIGLIQRLMASPC